MKFISRFSYCLMMALLVSFVAPKPASAGEGLTLTNTYLHIGVGTSMSGSTIQLGVDYRFGNNALNFRFLNSSDPSEGFSGSANRQLAVSYALGRTFGAVSVYGGAGIAAVFISSPPDTHSGGIVLGTLDGEPEMASFSITFKPSPNEERLTIGIPVEFQASWQFTRQLALTVRPFANLNNISSNAGITGGLQIRLPRQ